MRIARHLALYALLILCAAAVSTAAALVAWRVFGFDDFHTRAVAFATLCALSIPIAVYMDKRQNRRQDSRQ
jgi:hypothetical protein